MIVNADEPTDSSHAGAVPLMPFRMVRATETTKRARASSARLLAALALLASGCTSSTPAVSGDLLTPVSVDPTTDDWTLRAPLAVDGTSGRLALARIVGTYRHTFRNDVLDAGGAWTSVMSTDVLDVTRAASGVVEFDLLLNFTNGHTCNLEGEVSLLDEHTYRFEHGACHVLVRRSERGFTFDEESPPRCATSEACGARGTIAGSELPVSSSPSDSPGD